MDSNPVDSTKVLELAMIAEIEDMVPAEERRTFLGEIFGLFSTTAPVSLAEIEAAMGRADIKALEQHAHRLKGSCLSIGAVALASLCETIELAGRAGQMPEGGMAMVARMNKLFVSTKAELDQRLQSYAA